MTSAPWSASNMAVRGPAMYWPKSITRISVNTLGMSFLLLKLSLRWAIRRHHRLHLRGYSCERLQVCVSHIRHVWEDKNLPDREGKPGQHLFALQRIRTCQDIAIGTLAIDFHQAFGGIEKSDQPGAMREVVGRAFSHRRVGVIREFDFNDDIRHLENWAPRDHRAGRIHKHCQVRLAAVILVFR